MTIKLTKKQKMYVKRWLEGRDKESNCPFWPLEVPQGCDICEAYFPRIKGDGFPCICPCMLYAIRTVIKKAKEMVGEK